MAHQCTLALPTAVQLVYVVPLCTKGNTQGLPPCVCPGWSAPTTTKDVYPFPADAVTLHAPDVVAEQPHRVPLR